MKRPAMLQASLARRILAALLLAFALVAAALLARDYLAFKRGMSEQPGIRQLGGLMLAGIDGLADGAMAGQVLSGEMRYLNRLRRDAGMLPGELLLQLYDREDRLIYASSAAQPITQPGVAEQWLNGQRHWTWRADSDRWSVRLAEPALPELDLLGWLADGLGSSLLLAFPLVLLPLWLAVHTGLRPLRLFARRLGGVEADLELAPRELDLRYAELRPLGQAFGALMERLRQRLARERAFVHDAAHELRTPLAVIAAQAHVLVAARQEQDRQDAGERLLGAIRRTSHLSQQLLDLAALDGRGEALLQTQDLALVCARLLADLHGRARACGLDLAQEGPEQLLRHVDVSAFLSVLHNLLDNALRYVPRGGSVLLTLEGVGREGWRMTVADDGPGIAPAHRALVFERFWRGPQAEAPGSGLGLAIARQAAHRLGGGVRLTAGPGGRGCVFTLEVPGAVAERSAFGAS